MIFCIYGVNAEGKTTFVNPAAARMLGWSAAELVGKDMHSIVHHTRPDGMNNRKKLTKQSTAQDRLETRENTGVLIVRAPRKQ